MGKWETGDPPGGAASALRPCTETPPSALRILHIRVKQSGWGFHASLRSDLHVAAPSVPQGYE